MATQHLNDLLTGDMDFPSRQNREFGRMNADIFQPLKIGELGTMDEKTGNLTGIPDVGEDGTSIHPSILQDITEQQKIYIQEKKNIDFKKAKELSGKDLTIADIVKETKFFTAAFAAFDSRTKRVSGGAPTAAEFCYEPGQYEEWSLGHPSSEETTTDDAGIDTTTVTAGEGYVGAVEEYKESLGKVGENDWRLEEAYMQIFTGDVPGLQTAFLTFKHTLRHSLIKLLRADRYGVLANVDPLLPIDFEMEIDGTGGMFPGNSFHSSYLGDSYKTKSVFQMVGVDHTIDSSGWFTTVKGQIRSTSELPPLEHRTDEEKLEALIMEEDKKDAAAAAAKEFIEFQQEKLRDIAAARKIAVATATIRHDREKLIAMYTGKKPLKHFPDRPVDIAAKKLFKAMKGGGTHENKVYNALKTTYGYAVCQDALKAAFRKRAEVQGYSGKNLNLDHWLDWDFDNSKYKWWYTEVAILAGYSHGKYKGYGWGDGKNKDNGPPNCGPWIGKLKKTRTDRVKAPGKHAYPTGNYYIKG
jgi:hypothetical protein